MIRQYELIEKVRAYNPKADVGLINRAYVYSMKAHGNQKRASGQPYLVHPLAVAGILADLQLDDASIAVGLLHDTLEDTLSTYDEIKSLFGGEVADLTEGVTKLSKISFEDKAVEQAENFRKLLLAMSKDIRVLLIKLADRVHNMRTLGAFSNEQKKRRIARETMDIYAQLADRIGLHALKAELEDLAFQILEPDEYTAITRRMAEWREQDDLVGRVTAVLKDELTKAGIKAEVSGREKAIYSIYTKMVRKSLAFDQLTDIVAYRIVTETKRECYEVLGMMHDRFKAIPGRFKDYISAPKPNGYQSLHTSVVGPFGNRMEVQIRTREMHEVAENGVAAHWLYKPADGTNVKAEETQLAVPPTTDSRSSPYRWLKSLVEQLQGVDDPAEFYENAKLELFSDNVFAFTPKGDVIQLPRGATPLDFAYAVHSNLGNKTVSAKVNGSVVPLRRVLENGDMVEVVTSPHQQPNPGWREFVVSSRARAAINRFLRQQERVEQVRLGREILEKAARRDGWSWTEKEFAKIVSKLPVQQVESVEDAFAALGQGRLFPRQVMEIMAPELAQPLSPAKAADKTAEKAVERMAKRKAEENAGRIVDEAVGLEGITPGMSVHFAKCCSPLPGEDIVGIIATGKGINIHMRTCKNLEQFVDQPDRWLPVRWSGAAEHGDMRQFICRLRFHVKNDPGALALITSTIANADANIIEIATENRTPDSTSIRCEMEIKSKDHLNKLIQHLSGLKVMLRVEKIYGWS
ncbi:MAG: bifunctional (p)ppGpp synthetase/guanosine-3',5'-bis(diphosphate) 3'-pyrophosphohydrolase [Blastochloris viridis]|uniref:GTP pyrophosphokinase rsh n=1 Tax=Blastochloris viridis TaxID=1079 RepID=A0A6N4RF36_BLAVI|nr:MAG: bifunctional (p)ppGpp synthetase/guanosine-3',5'-bis(diphosphate) 3'-pyrophosphohydrolase [Blastochloris viridis]